MNFKRTEQISMNLQFSAVFKGSNVSSVQFLFRKCNDRL